MDKKTACTVGRGERQISTAERLSTLPRYVARSADARSMFARGHYDADENVFTAFKLGVYLLEP